MAPAKTPSGRESSYTTEQVLRGIQAFVTENCGEEVVIDPDASVYAYYAAAAESHECPLLFLHDLAEYFELNWREKRWVVWLKLRGNSAWTRRRREEEWEQWKLEVAPQLTVRKLADYIARRAPAPSFEPVVVFGRECAPAGVFLGLCDLPEAKSQRIAPSTPLRNLRSAWKMTDLWKRAEWICGVTLPPTNPASCRNWGSLANGVLLATWGLALCVAFCIGLRIALNVDAGSGMLLGLISGAVVLCIGYKLVDRFHNPLPSEVGTFGDLARLIDRRLRESPRPAA